MGLGSLILLPKQLRELGCTYVFHPGYHGNADTTIKFCRPFIVLTKSWYLYCQSFPPWPIDYKLFNPGYLGNSHYMEKSCMKSSGHYTFMLSKNPGSKK